MEIIDLYFNRGMAAVNIQKHMFNLNDIVAARSRAAIISRITNGVSYKNLERPKVSSEQLELRQRSWRIYRTITKDDITGCHSSSMLNVTHKSTSISVARCIYELNKGCAPDGKFVTTTCKNTDCVNIEHLEVSDAAASQAKSITLWKKGVAPITFSSIKEASIFVGSYPRGLSDAAKRGQSTYKGYNFKIEE